MPTAALSAPQKSHKYLSVFLLGTLMYIAAVLPSIIAGGGLFYYYGDYSANYIEGVMLTVRSLQEGHFFWNPVIDFGSSLFNSFGTSSGGFTTSFFTYLLLPFPVEWIPHLLPFIMSLKYGLAALTSFIWLRGFTITDKAALIGALLYAFSGFQAINVVYGIFHDITAFFPLYLYTFDRLIQKKGKIGFSIMTAVMAFQSLYFLFGQIIFMLVYYFVRYFRIKDIKSGIKQLCSALIYGAIGMAITGVFLLDGIFGLIGTGRIDNMVSGSAILAYKNGSTIWEGIKSMFFIPEHMGSQGLFFNTEIDWGSVSLYLPFISISGVVAYFVSVKGRLKRDWKGKLTIILFVMAVIPALNSSFSLFNTEYYARWFYMLILILCLLTVRALEKGELKGMKIGTGVVIGFTVLFSVIMTLSSNAYIYILAFSLLTAPLLVCFTLKGKEKASESRFINKGTLIITAISCCISTGLVLFSGNNIFSNEAKAFFKENVVNNPPELVDSTSGRIEVANKHNWEFIWNTPGTGSFVTTVTPSIFSILKNLQNGRTQRSEILPQNNGLRQLVSTKYYINVTKDTKARLPAIIEGVWKYDESDKDKKDNSKESIPLGFEKIESADGFDIYENKHLIPMGFTFDSYVLEDDIKALIDNEKDNSKEENDIQWVSTRLLVKDIVLNSEQANRYKDIFTFNDDYEKPLSNSEFLSECDKRAETACTSFTYDKDGYTAETTLEKDNLIFFSIPWDKGFSAFVDGIETKIEEVDFGFMAIPVKAGTHTIRFYYRPHLTAAGIVVSVMGIFALFLAIIYGKKKRKSALTRQNKPDLWLYR